MNISIESTGKNLDEAIKNGLAELNVTLDDVDVEIIESGGWFKKAKVRLTVIEEETFSALDELKKLDKRKRIDQLYARNDCDYCIQTAGYKA